MGGALSQRAGEALHLRVFVDHSCVEVFTGSGEVLSTRIYRGQRPEHAVDPDISFVAFGGPARVVRCSAYEMDGAWQAATSTAGAGMAGASPKAANLKAAAAAAAARQQREEAPAAVVAAEPDGPPSAGASLPAGGLLFTGQAGAAVDARFAELVSVPAIG